MTKIAVFFSKESIVTLQSILYNVIFIFWNGGTSELIRKTRKITIMLQMAFVFMYK